MKKNLFIISLGGSLIFPEEIDIQFLKNLKNLIISQTKQGKKFILITGGGKVCRKYQGALKQISATNPINLDWMGIYVTQTNAHFVRLLLGKLAYKKIAVNPEVKIEFKEKVLLAAGFEPGWSTDYCAVALAKTYGAKIVINLSNIDFLYDKDPKKFKNVKKLEKTTWKNLLKITGNKWSPGANLPFDPVAARFAQREKLKVIIANGKNLANLKNILENRPFTGTTIE